MEHAPHRSVLLGEVLAALACRPGGRAIDGTIGAGGHAEAILDATSPDGRLFGLDRDPAAIALAARRLARFGDRVVLRQADHRRLPELLEDLGAFPADAILLDLGLSSMQLDDPARGFSFLRDGPLDMRMDPALSGTAADLVNRLDERGLATLFTRFGEEPHARHLARVLVRERGRAPFTSTTALAETIARALPGPPRGTHPATRVFQALRIAVNDEIGYLPALLEECARRLAPGGRLAVIAFHSLEDRAVKETFRALGHRCVCPRDLPRCGCDRPDLVRAVTKGAVKASIEEMRANPRSRSARLRAVERLAA
ncbi:MAG TPA: 16S rRNA (cytosine(1402)-N(4))-methyltransferase RsmH [Dongiaceae bacterium]|nr:16S rRNA (cytosine(1402)-N(4))-methyltransferase RsmH [Dongiaceae bacterium]